MDKDGEPMPACLAKQLFAQHVQFGDWVRFPAGRLDATDIDAVVAWNDAGRRSGVFVNTGRARRLLTVSDWDDSLHPCGELLRLDASTGERVVREPFTGTIELNGYGVAVVSNTAAGVED
jgi:hypothetical protein